MLPDPGRLPLSKTLDPADFTELAEELRIVDQHFTKDREQHPMRRWEYAMALRALDTWIAQQPAYRTPSVIDIGGAGSPFWRMVSDHTIVVDPDQGQTLAQYLKGCPRLVEAVFCLSVLEHVDDLDQFLYHLSCLTAPGGLLFVTMDCRESEGVPDSCWPVDDRHFHWMRKRIFTPRLMQDCVCAPLSYLGFWQLGDVDWTYHGPHVYDYTFASLALVKRS